MQAAKGGPATPSGDDQPPEPTFDAPAELLLARVLDNLGPTHSRDLSARTGLTVAEVERALDRLEKRGRVVRGPSSDATDAPGATTSSAARDTPRRSARASAAADRSPDPTTTR